MRLPPTAEPKDPNAIDEAPIDNTRHYCLYVRYCENLTEPVSAYATDEGCSYQSCQPTRVSEGVSFELRCSECAEHSQDIRDRICECVGDVDSAYQTTLRSNTFYGAARLMTPVPDVAFNDRAQAAENFLRTVVPLAEARIPAPRPAVPVAPVAEFEKASEAERRILADRLNLTAQPAAELISADDFEGWLFDVHTASAHLASYYLAQKTQAAAPKGEVYNEAAAADKAAAAANEPSEAQIRVAEKQFADTTGALKAVVKDVDSSEQARGYYDAALGHASEIVTKKSDNAEPFLQNVAKGYLLLASDIRDSAESLAAMKEELLDRLDQSPRVGDCQLRFDVESIRIPGPNATESDWKNALQQIHAAWVRYLKDCVCAALNPPCAPCEDPAVLLACIKVKDCEVIEICNLKRKFVISGPALRYWFPPLTMLGDALEKLCCPDPICIEEAVDPASIKRGMAMQGISRSRLGQKIPGRVNFSIFSFLCRSQVKRAYINRRVPSLGQVITMRRIGEDVSWQDSLRNAGALLMKRIGMPAFTVKQPVVDAGSPFETLSSILADKGFTKMVGDTFKTESKRVEKAIAERTDKKVKAATVKLGASAEKDRKELKLLTKENAELKKTIKELGDSAKELMDRVAKLEKGTS